MTNSKSKTSERIHENNPNANKDNKIYPHNSGNNQSSEKNRTNKLSNNKSNPKNLRLSQKERLFKKNNDVTITINVKDIQPIRKSKPLSNSKRSNSKNLFKNQITDKSETASIKSDLVLFNSAILA